MFCAIVDRICAKFVVQWVTQPGPLLQTYFRVNVVHMIKQCHKIVVYPIAKSRPQLLDYNATRRNGFVYCEESVDWLCDMRGTNHRTRFRCQNLQVGFGQNQSNRGGDEGLSC